MRSASRAEALAGLTVASSALAAGLRHRKLLGSWAITAVLSRRPLVGPVKLRAGIEWWDDWFTVEHIDGSTIAIGEPRYYQLNHSYLVLGRERALLFDSGPGVRPIGAVVTDLTDLPVTVVASHMHFDHVGGHVDFDDIGLVEIPGQVGLTNGTFTPSLQQHLGLLEAKSSRPTIRPSITWQVGASIELGGRSLEVVHTPGHSADSLCLWDSTNNLLFSGDTMYRGDLLAATADADLGQYRNSAEMLIDLIAADTAVLGAHTIGERPEAPRLGRQDLIDLLPAIESAAGRRTTPLSLPRRHRVNDEITLFAS